VRWVVNATATDNNGDGVDGYEYVTVEPQELIQQKYPHLIASFREAEVERAKQGNSLEGSRAYVRQAVVHLRSHTELIRVETATNAIWNEYSERVVRERPASKEITKALLQNQGPCYEVRWVVNATATDNNV
jgi:hypothetical protein